MIFIWYFHRLSIGTFYKKSSFGFWGLHCTTKTNVKVNPQRKNTSGIDPQTYQSTFLPSVDSQILFFIWNLLDFFFQHNLKLLAEVQHTFQQHIWNLSTTYGTSTGQGKRIPECPSTFKIWTYIYIVRNLNISTLAVPSIVLCLFELISLIFISMHF